MKNKVAPENSKSSSNPKPCSPWPWILAVGCVVVIFVGLFHPGESGDYSPADAAPTVAKVASVSTKPSSASAPVFAHDPVLPFPHTVEEIVAGKLSQFAKSRRELAHALARRHNVEVPEDVERFFAAVESGKWEDIEATFSKIDGGDSSAGASPNRSPALLHLWPAIIDAFGAAEQVHEWPAQKLLDYGNAVLDSLRPGMVYVGGTDNGRWIPELLNDTSEGERHIVITQNGLADSTYLDYVRLQYDDRMGNLSDDDSQRAFKEYVADAEKRLKHDQEHPEEPKQIRPGENIRIEDGKTQVSGRVAVMSINESLLQSLIAKNPDLSFAIQESIPLKGTYAEAMPLGPLMELHAEDGQTAFNAERAAQTLDYWRNTAQQILSDPVSADSTVALKSYSHDAVATANLLAAHNFISEAEEAYRTAARLWPGNPESIGGLAEILGRSGRDEEARQLLNDFVRKYPDQQKDLEQVSATFRFETSPPPKDP